ncbi:hypothetical protein MKX67_00895 [Cytobacillus sp. FSL W7-1323]|nr:hypothetical protein [Cytobacillus sp. OWB-43]MEA1855670.1 hypothetical protein [Cytobacillus sp. OWB-43]
MFDYKAVLANKSVVAKPVHSKPVSKPAAKPSGEYKGSSIVDYLKSKGINSSFNNRKKLASQHGIKNYSGTPAQNLTLLEKMKKKGTTQTSKSAKKGDMKTTSVVDYLKSINVDSSFANRKKLASKYGIKNYKGTRDKILNYLAN